MIPYGSLVVYVTPNKDRRYIKRLEEGQDWHSNDGVLSAEAVHAANFGSEVRTSLDIPIRVLEATLHDRLKGLKRQTQIIYPKDIAYICLRLGAGPGRTIIEAGCGSGGLTTGLSWPAATSNGPAWATMWRSSTATSPTVSASITPTPSSSTCAPPGNTSTTPSKP